jgi:predicted enzyme related to lactoylglutathione lyase
MSLKLKRVIIFTNKMSELTAFYGEQLGLPALIDPEYDAKEWIEFDAGGSKIALHQAHGRGKGGGCAHKIVFYAKDVANARAALTRKKVKMGKLHRFGKLQLCDGIDPAGNRIQISNRP